VLTGLLKRIDRKIGRGAVTIGTAADVEAFGKGEDE